MNSQFSHPGKATGFSLIEVVMALGIISFCLVGLSGLFTVCLDASKKSDDATREALLFQRVIDQLRIASAGYDPVSQTYPQQQGSKEEDLFPLPELNKSGDETNFTVDEYGRFLQSGDAVTKESRKVVKVRIMDPSEFPAENLTTPMSLSAEGKVAFVRVTIRAAQGYKAGEETPNSPIHDYVTELSLLNQ